MEQSGCRRVWAMITEPDLAEHLGRLETELPEISHSPLRMRTVPSPSRRLKRARHGRQRTRPSVARQSVQVDSCETGLVR